MGLKLIPPGSRKNNTHYFVRGIVNRRRYEVSAKTEDEAQATIFLAEFERALEANAGRHHIDFAVNEVSILPVETIFQNRMMPRCGIYFLFEDRMLQYIGQSSNIWHRVFRHTERSTFPFNNWCGVPCEIFDLDLIEAAYISAYRPPCNLGTNRNRAKSGGKSKKSGGSNDQ